MCLHHLTFAREPVPWTNLEAIVAAKDAVANRRAQFNRDGPLQLNGQVRDAPPRIELERGGDGRRRARGDAACAGAAAVLLRRIRLKVQRSDDFGQKEPVAQLATDEIGVLADEPQPGALRQIAFEQRPGVHIPQRARALLLTSISALTGRGAVSLSSFRGEGQGEEAVAAPPPPRWNGRRGPGAAG